MPLYIKDDAVDALAERFQKVVHARSKTEAVKLALQRAIEAHQPEALAELAAAFARNLRTRGSKAAALPVDKAFRDSLYD